MPRKGRPVKAATNMRRIRNFLRRPGCSSHSHPQSSQRVQILMRTGPPGRCELHIGAVLVQAQAAARDGEIKSRLVFRRCAAQFVPTEAALLFLGIQFSRLQ